MCSAIPILSNAYSLLSGGYKSCLKKLKEMRIPDIQYSCSLVSAGNEFAHFVFPGICYSTAVHILFNLLLHLITFPHSPNVLGRQGYRIGILSHTILPSESLFPVAFILHFPIFCFAFLCILQSSVLFFLIKSIEV